MMHNVLDRQSLETLLNIPLQVLTDTRCFHCKQMSSVRSCCFVTNAITGAYTLQEVREASPAASNTVHARHLKATLAGML